MHVRFHATAACVLLLLGAEAASSGHSSAGPSFGVASAGGVPRVAVDGKPVAGMCAMPKFFSRPKDVTRAMKDFADIGVKFYSESWFGEYPKRNDWWLGEGKYDFVAFDRRVKGILDASSDGWMFPRILMNPPEWWRRKFPGEIRSKEPRPDSDAWRHLYRRMLEDVVRHVESSPYADRVMGYHIGALHCGEWLVDPWPADEEPPVEWDRRDPLPPLEATAARRAYIRKRSKDVADALLDAAGLVKRLTGGRKLVGAFFCYMNTGDHEESARILRSPLVDFIASPGDYDVRRGGQSGRFQMAWPASCRLHGKIYWDEADIRTYHAKAYPNIVRYRCTTEAESVGAIKRNIGYLLTGGWEAWWFLLAGNDTFRDEAMLAPIRVALAEERSTLLTAQWQPADVAVFTSPDEYSTSRLAVRRGFPLRKHCKIDFHLNTMPFAGVAYDSYDLADIEDPNLPDYKVYVFPNAFALGEERRKAIKRRVRRAGKTAVWLYAPGYYRNGSGTVENVAELTGIRLKECYPVAKGNISRIFTAEGDGTFATNGWRSVYFPERVTAAALRRAFSDAGAHVWVDTPDVIAAGRGYLMVHAAEDGRKTIRLPMNGNVSEIFGARAPLKNVEIFEDDFTKGETRIYKIEKQSP